MAATRSVDTITQPDIDAGEEKLRLAKEAFNRADKAAGETYAATRNKPRLTSRQLWALPMTTIKRTLPSLSGPTSSPATKSRLTAGSRTARLIKSAKPAAIIEQEYNEAREQRQVVWNDYLNSIKAASAA
ncbi:MAG: hypothetical protein IPO31_15070 [Candidatus Obscuribacter sp.]|nr:hypothetical protein [Candidatus Obscuribacter sp.]